MIARQMTTQPLEWRFCQPLETYKGLLFAVALTLIYIVSLIASALCRLQPTPQHHHPPLHSPLPSRRIYFDWFALQACWLFAVVVVSLLLLNRCYRYTHTQIPQHNLNDIVAAYLATSVACNLFPLAVVCLLIQRSFTSIISSACLRPPTLAVLVVYYALTSLLINWFDNWQFECATLAVKVSVCHKRECTCAFMVWYTTITLHCTWIMHANSAYCINNYGECEGFW